MRRAANAVAVDALLFEAVADLYVASHASAWSGIHERQFRNSMRDHVLPLLGSIPVNAIDTGAVMRVLDPIWHTKAETASRVRQRVENVLDYASTRGWREGANPARWKGHLANLLPSKDRVAPVQIGARTPISCSCSASCAVPTRPTLQQRC